MKYWSLSLVILFLSCSNPPSEDKKILYQVTSEPFGNLPGGKEVTKYNLKASSGFSVSVIDYGGIITSIMMPGKNGELGDVVLGYENVEKYVEGSPYFGALIGRYGNRIAKGKFSLDGEDYQLAVNNGVNHLHGGTKGFDKVLWSVREETTEDYVKLTLTRTSPDMEEGYPGNLAVEVDYIVKDEATLELHYRATTDKKTIVNLTNHSYFNFSGGQESILDHELTLNASRYLPVDSTLIPTGELAAVENTPFDFKKAKKIRTDIDQDNEQLRFGAGFDHCWVTSATSSNEMRFIARLYHEKSSRQMEIFSTEPAIQFYSGNFLDGSNIGKKNITYHHRWGLCLETQHFPDSPNQPGFPAVILEPGEKYVTSTKMIFSLK